MRKNGEPEAPAIPKWYVSMQGVLQQYEAGQITGDQFLDLQDENFEQSGLSMDQYVRAVNEFEANK